MNHEFNPGLAFLAELEDGYTPTDEIAERIANALHAAMAPEPIMDYMSTNFEAVGDAIHRARIARNMAIDNAKEFFRLRNEFAKFQYLQGDAT